MSTTSTARHRAPARKLGRWAIPSFAAFLGWLAEGDPFGAAGFGAFVLLGLLFSLAYPLLALLAVEAPGALVPWQWRAWHRRGREHRPGVSARLRRVVYAADRHACCLPWCRSASSGLQIEHVRPWCLGGRNSFWNFCTLCGYHNRVKSDYWEFRDGRRNYHSFTGHANPAEAARILAFEKRHRWSPARFARAALAL